MKPRPFILRIAAFILLLAFSQKAGAGLLLHNLFHHTATEPGTPGNNQDTNSSYNCSCIDDFLMPFSPAEETVLTIPAPVVEVPFIFFAEKIPFRLLVFASLRGPPACSL